MPERALPADLDAEEMTLSAMMLSSKAIDAVLDVGLAAADFSRGSHGLIFAAVLRLYGNGNPVDQVTLADDLAQAGRLDDVGGRERLQEIGALVPAAGRARHYARIVRENAMLRGFVTAGAEMQRLGWDRPGDMPTLIEEAERLVFDLTLSRNTADPVTLHETLGETFTRIERLHREGREVVGVPTGYERLDKLTSGLQPGNLVVLAARPSIGKSALALGIAANVTVRSKLPVALFTLEMGRGEVTDRLLSFEGLVESQYIRNGKLGREEWQRITDAASRLDPAPLLIDDSAALTALELRSKARRVKLRNPDLALIVVDYLQLMTSGAKAENRNQDVSQISRALKVLASELQLPVLTLSQLSRDVEKRHDKRPMLSDLRESGSIEQDADVVLMLYRDDYYNEDDLDSDQRGIAELHIAKHRNGPTGLVKLAFTERFAKFSDLAL